MPTGIVEDNNQNIWVSDFASHRLFKGTRDETGSIIDFSVASDNKYSYPVGLCVDKHNNLYVADSENSCIRKIEASTNKITIIAGNTKKGYVDGKLLQAQFNQPWGIAIDEDGDLYVCDRRNCCVR